MFKSIALYTLLAVTAVQGAAIGKNNTESEPVITPFANEGAVVEGHYWSFVNVIAQLNVNCRLKQNGKTIFNPQCSSTDYNKLKCSKCESNKNLKLCVDQNGCSLYDSKGSKFWSHKWDNPRTEMTTCPGGTPAGPGCIKTTSDSEWGVRI